MTRLQEWLDRACRRAGSQNRFAIQLGVASSYLTRWINQGHVPESYWAEPLARVTGTPLEEVTALIDEARRLRSLDRRRPGPLTPGAASRPMPLAAPADEAPPVVAISPITRPTRRMRMPNKSAKLQGMEEVFRQVVFDWWGRYAA